MKYKNQWKPNSLNKEFWEEVLVGRQITSIDFDKDGLNSITLDNGEKVYMVGDQGSLMIYI